MFIFSISVYLFYLQYRQEDLLIRLKNKAKNTVTLFADIKGVDTRFMKTIDEHTLTNMNDVLVILLNKKKEILYCNQDSAKVSSLLPNFKRLDWEKNSSVFIKKRLFLSLKHNYQNKQYYVLASAYDLYGEAELKKLLTILEVVFVSSILLIIFAGFINAEQSLRPIKEIIKQVKKIKANNLNQRLEIDYNDEIGELAVNFNNMLDRIENAFETERMFVSNASHELRTPITSIKGQIEVGLINKRSVEEYEIILNSILDDIENMITIINGFLELAEANIEIKNFAYDQIRLDEFLFAVKDEIIKRKPGYQIVIEYVKIPMDEKEITIAGNKRLLKIMLMNLIDNACKFSSNKKVVVKITFDQDFVILKFIDSGVGIPKNELNKVMRPLYRASNVNGQPGHGIGLSIVQKIAEIHDAAIDFSSEVNEGTTVTLSIKRKD
jgi:signal transduction histidine kinase